MDYNIFDDSDFYDYIIRQRGPDLELLFSSDSDTEEPLNEHDDIIIISDDSDDENESRDNNDMEQEPEEIIYISSDTEEEEVIHHRNNGSICIKRKKIKQPIMHSTKCLDCDAPFIDSPNSIFIRRKVSGQSFCHGCAYLRKKFRSSKEYKVIINWLLTGATSLKNSHNKNLDYLEETLQNLREIVGTKESKSRKKYFYQLCIQNNLRCAVTGHVLRHTVGYVTPWSLTLDHIEPKSRRTNSSKSMYNSQIMCSLLNSLKGDLDNQELLNWWDGFKKAHGH